MIDIATGRIYSAELPAGTHEVEEIQFKGQFWLVLTGPEKIGATTAYWLAWQNEKPDPDPSNPKNNHLIDWGMSEVVIQV
jgi:hypothetical protein